MSKYLANVFLDKSPNNLLELEAELRKTLKGHMSGTWRKPRFHTPYLWEFDELCIRGGLGEFFVDGTFSPLLGKAEKANISIEEFFDRVSPEFYVRSADLSDGSLEEIIERGEVLFPNGSYISRGRFHLGRQSEIEKLLNVRFSRDILRALISAGGAQASKELLKVSDGALLLCEFRESPQF